MFGVLLKIDVASRLKRCDLILPLMVSADLVVVRACRSLAASYLESTARVRPAYQSFSFESRRFPFFNCTTTWSGTEDRYHHLFPTLLCLRAAEVICVLSPSSLFQSALAHSRTHLPKTRAGSQDLLTLRTDPRPFHRWSNELEAIGIEQQTRKRFQEDMLVPPVFVRLRSLPPSS